MVFVGASAIGATTAGATSTGGTGAGAARFDGAAACGGVLGSRVSDDVEDAGDDMDDMGGEKCCVIGRCSAHCGTRWVGACGDVAVRSGDRDGSSGVVGAGICKWTDGGDG